MKRRINMGLKDSIRDNFKMVAFKTYLETVYLCLE